MENQRQEPRMILLSLSVFYKGDLDAVYKAIAEKKIPSDIDSLDIEESIKNHSLTILDPDYPKRFNQGFKPPLIMYYKGDVSLLNRKIVVVLNSKNASNYATTSLLDIIGNMPNAEVVSVPVNTTSYPLAKKAVESGLKVIGVSNKAIDSKAYNDVQKELIDLILKNDGLVITEVPDNTEGDGSRILWLRLLAVSGQVILVGGLPKRDGFIHTVAIALNSGADVYCIPFTIDSNYINNSLIQEGAMLIESGEEITFKENY